MGEKKESEREKREETTVKVKFKMLLITHVIC